MKKILALALTLFMIFSIIPLTAYSDDECEHVPGDPIIEPSTRFTKGSRSVYCTICNKLLEYEELPEIPFHEVGSVTSYSDVNITVDGDISEWLNMFPITAENVRNYVGRIPIDLGFVQRLGFCWDDDNLYIAGYYEDDTFALASGTNWDGVTGDCAIISLDFSGICARYYVSNAPNYNIFMENSENGPVADITCSRYSGSNVENNAQVKGRVLDGNSGWQFECAIPWENIVEDYNGCFKKQMGWNPGITYNSNVKHGSIIHVLHAYTDYAIDEDYGSAYHKGTYSTTSDSYGNIGNGRQVKEAGIFMTLSRCEHESIEYINDQPVCTEPGTRTKFCTVCGEKFEITTLDPHAHGETYRRVTKETTCGKEGIETEYCSVCGSEVAEHPIARLPHTPGSWEIYKYPTYEESGKKVRKCLVCGQIAEEEDTAPPEWRFTDVSPNAWYYTPVRNIFCRGYMVGSSATEFSPDAVVTRGMFVTMLAAVAEYDRNEYAGPSSFEDVRENDWFAPAVNWAEKNEITGGYGSVFGADDPLTREQMVVMLRRFAEYLGVADGKSSDLRYFRDYMQIDEWAKDALSWAVCCSLISGTSPDILSPRGISTRSQVAAVLNKFTVLIEK